MATTTRRTPLVGPLPLRALTLVAAAALGLSACGAEPTASPTAPTSALTQAPEADLSDPTPEETGQDAAPEPAAVPASLTFSATTVAGDAFDGASVAGKPTVFWFWAPWCATCRAQISGVSGLASQFGDEVTVVGVGALEDVGAIEEFAGTVPGDVTMLSDPDGAVWRHFGVTAQSTYVVLDAAGEKQASGFIDTDTLVSTVSSLVAG